MIEWFMFGALGFFLGCLLALMLAPPLWNRAVKLTTRRLEATMPMTLADIQADKDQLRAEFAIELRKVEVALDKSKEKAARELIEANKRRVEIQELTTQIGGVKSELQESQNANRVLQQTIKRRLPDLDARLKAAKKALIDLETVNAELRNTVASQSEALKIARGTVHNQRADIDRLRLSLESGSAAAMRGSGKSDGRAVAESQRLAAELSRAQEELERAKTSAEDVAFLRRELNRLASHILTAARNQAAYAQPTTATQEAQPQEAQPQQAAPQEYVEQEHVEQEYVEHAHAEAYVEQEAVDPAQAEAVDDVMAQEAAWHAQATNGSGEHAAEEHMAADPNAEPADYAEGDAEPYEEAAPHEHNMEAHEAHEEVYADDEDLAHEDHDEEEPPKKGLAARFAARRAKRSADKAGGGSLTSRLRSVVAKSPEART